MADITVFEKKSHPIIEEAKELAITDDKTMERGTELLTQMNTALKSLTAEEDKVLVPMKEAMAAEKARWSPLKDTLKEGIAALRNAMSVYQTNAMKKAQEEKDRIANKVGPGKGKLKPGTAIKKMEEVNTPQKAAVSKSGLVKFRTDKVLKITDETLIPREYLVINEKAVFAALKTGIAIPGAELEEKQVPINTRF